MAATTVNPIYLKLGAGMHRAIVTIPTTVDGTDGSSTNLEFGPLRSLTFEYVSSNWNSKTLVVFGGNDGSNFYVLATAISVTANGIKGVAVADLGYRFYQVNLSGAPTAALVVTAIGCLVSG